METETAAHLSIGEVLSLLTDEFPDVTISKIRFLESQGLIDPERTPSGYRKFYESDIDRLRWVLIQQRDYFLPLKVIKAKLDQGGVDYSDDSPAQPNLFDQVDDGDGDERGRGNGATPDARPSAADPPAASAPSEAAAETSDDAPASSAEASDDGDRDPAAWLAALQEDPNAKADPVAKAVPSRPVESILDEVGDARFTVDELAAEVGLSVDEIDQLTEFGLLTTTAAAGERTYDEASERVARAVAPFLKKGIEARHLRAYKLAAEREAGLYEQLVVPLLRQRNPQSKDAAVQLVAELTEQGEDVRRALLRQALRSHLG